MKNLIGFCLYVLIIFSQSLFNMISIILLFNKIQKQHFFNEIFFEKYFHKVPLHVAIKKQNFEIIQLLLQNPKINVNISIILFH